jgi:hypothetical protein
VRADGSGDQPDIQTAINTAADGDEIVLADGRFAGDGNRDLDFRGKEITIRSQSGDPLQCIIDCEGSVAEPHRAFRFHTGETRASVVRGITIENGHTPDEGGAVRCERKTAPTFRNVNFVANDSRAVFATVASPWFDRCYFANNPGGAITCSDSSSMKVTWTGFNNNQVQGSGGAVEVFISAVELVDCQFSGNGASVDGGSVYASGSPEIPAKLTLTRCSVQGSSASSDGGALNARRTDLNLEACEFVTNQAGDEGGAVYMDSQTRGFIVNSLFANNTASDGAALMWGFETTTTVENSIVVSSEGGSPVACNAAGATPRFICSDIYGNEAGDWTGCIASQAALDGNFSADPLFCEVPLGDFTVREDSPCAPTGPCGQVGPNGVGCPAASLRTVSPDGFRERLRGAAFYPRW